MEYLLICVVAGVAALLTLFSGFGLGTLLMPAFALFFPLELAVAATAVVHFANNLFKSALLLRHANRQVLLQFGLPALLAAILGALALNQLALSSVPLYEYSLFGSAHRVTSLKLVIGLLILGFAIFEMLPISERLQMPTAMLPLGGAVSGFLGGLSGHQGAMRAVFLRRLSLTPTAFAATQAAIALLVDVARLGVYASLFRAAIAGPVAVPPPLVASACLAAFAGSLLGRRLLPKVTIGQVRWLTAGLLLLLGNLLLTGII